LVKTVVEYRALIRRFGLAAVVVDLDQALLCRWDYGSARHRIPAKGLRLLAHRIVGKGTMTVLLAFVVWIRCRNMSRWTLLYTAALVEVRCWVAAFAHEVCRSATGLTGAVAIPADQRIKGDRVVPWDLTAAFP
jgi:hypothetical protein